MTFLFISLGALIVVVILYWIDSEQQFKYMNKRIDLEMELLRLELGLKEKSIVDKKADIVCDNCEDVVEEKGDWCDSCRNLR
jgi:hypothetical protein